MRNGGTGGAQRWHLATRLSGLAEMLIHNSLEVEGSHHFEDCLHEHWDAPHTFSLLLGSVEPRQASVAAQREGPWVD